MASASSSSADANNASVAAIKRRCPCRVHGTPDRANATLPTSPARPFVTPISDTHLIVIIAAGCCSALCFACLMYDTLARDGLSQQRVPSNILTGQAPVVKVTATPYRQRRR